MADILMNQFEIEDKVGIKPGVDVIGTLIIEAKENLERRVAREKSFWIDPSNDEVKAIRRRDGGEFERQHIKFTKSNGIALIHMFLTKKDSAYEYYFKKIIDPVYYKTNLKLRGSLIEKIAKFEEKEKAK